MNDTRNRLTNPPIIEAVLDIDCDLPPGQDLVALETAARDTFRSDYPKLRKQLLHEVQFTTKPSVAPESTVRPQRLQAYQFLTQDERQLVQVRAQGYSFNRLSPYTSLDDYLPEIERTWGAYRLLALPIQVRAVRLRYINRIPLPIVDGRCKLDAYLKAAPALPDEGRLALTGFMTQQAAVEIETGHQVNIVLAAQKPQENKLPVVLDICVAAAGPAEAADWAWLLNKIGSIRTECEQTFIESVTEQCLSLFR